MANNAKAVFQSRGSARNFLLSKTDTGPIKDRDKKRAAGVNEGLQSVFPDMLVGRGFIDHAVVLLDSVAQFAALAVGVDQNQQEDQKYSNPDALDKHVEVAGILKMICLEKNGLWGVLEPGLFGSIFPEINGSEGLELARDIQDRLAALAQVFDSGAQDRNSAALGLLDATVTPFGSGPYELVRIRDDGTYVLKANPKHTRSVAKIKRMGGDAVKVLAWYRPDASDSAYDTLQAVMGP